MKKFDRNSLFLIFCLLFSPLMGATEFMGNKKVSISSDRNTMILYENIVCGLFKLCDFYEELQDVRAEADKLIQKAKKHGLLVDLLSYQNIHQETLLHYALKKGCIEVAFVLIENGTEASLAIINEYNQLATHIAAMLNYPDLIKLLHEKYPISFLAKDMYGRIPLHYAAEKEALLILDMMIGFIPKTIDMQDNDNNTAAHLCESQESLRIFMQHGADFGLKNKQDRSVQDKLIEAYGESAMRKKRFPDCPLV